MCLDFVSTSRDEGGSLEVAQCMPVSHPHSNISHFLVDFSKWGRQFRTTEKFGKAFKLALKHSVIYNTHVCIYVQCVCYYMMYMWESVTAQVLQE